jgi:hypothetical protein
MRDHAHLGTVVLAVLALGVGTPASAQFTLTNNSGTATAETFFGTGSFIPPQKVVTSFGPNGGVAVSDIDLTPFGRMRGVQSGLGLNAVAVDAHLQDLPFFDWSARTTYDVTVESAGSFTPLLDFQYHVNGGQLELLDPAQLFAGTLARVSASIFTISPGFSGFLWSWVLSLRGDGFGNVNSSVDFFIDPLGFGMPALSPITINNGRAAMTIGSFTANANLGRLSPGNSAFVTYDMDAVVSGPGFGGGGIARLGDPFDPTGNYGAGISFSTATVATPEPQTLVLLATGLLLVGVVRRVSTSTFNGRTARWL